MTEWTWVPRHVLIALHDEQIAEHGGDVRLRDEGLLDSALARPKNVAAYGRATVATLAAAYAFGLVKSHPFVDGNKRTAAVVMELFLELNGWHLTADDASLVTTVLSLADGSLDETDVASWLRENTRRS